MCMFSPLQIQDIEPRYCSFMTTLCLLLSDTARELLPRLYAAGN